MGPSLKIGRIGGFARKYEAREADPQANNGDLETAVDSKVKEGKGLA